MWRFRKRARLQKRVVSGRLHGLDMVEEVGETEEGVSGLGSQILASSGNFKSLNGSSV